MVASVRKTNVIPMKSTPSYLKLIHLGVFVLLNWVLVKLFTFIAQDIIRIHALYLSKGIPYFIFFFSSLICLRVNKHKSGQGIISLYLSGLIALSPFLYLGSLKGFLIVSLGFLLSFLLCLRCLKKSFLLGFFLSISIGLFLLTSQPLILESFDFYDDGQGELKNATLLFRGRGGGSPILDRSEITSPLFSCKNEYSQKQKLFYFYFTDVRQINERLRFSAKMNQSKSERVVVRSVCLDVGFPFMNSIDKEDVKYCDYIASQSEIFALRSSLNLWILPKGVFMDSNGSFRPCDSVAKAKKLMEIPTHLQDYISEFDGDFPYK